MKRLRVDTPRHRADKAAEYRIASPVTICALERGTIGAAIERYSRCRINAVQLANSSANAIRFAGFTRKGHAIACINLIIPGKPNRIGEAYFADEAADIATVRIADFGRTGELLVVRAERELGRLTDEATAGSFANNGETGKINQVSERNSHTILAEANQAASASSIFGG